MFKITGSFVPFAGNDLMFNTQTSIHGNVVDSCLIILSDSGIYYHGYNGVQTFAGSGLFDGWVLLFPMSQQSSWARAGSNIKVIASGQSLTVGGNNYVNVYTLQQSVVTPGAIVTDTLLIAPQVGILKWRGFPLISYHLN